MKRRPRKVARRRVARPRVVRKRGGAMNLRSLLSSAHKFIKDKKLISGALSHFGNFKLSSQLWTKETCRKTQTNR